MKTKMIVGVSLFVFFVGLVSIVTSGLIWGEINKNYSGAQADNTQLGNVAGDNSSGQQSGGATGVIASTSLTSAEIAKHNKAADCWMIINGKVYNLTKFLADHPGGSSIMIPYCGKDGTSAFNTKGKPSGQPHSSSALSLLPNYFIGNLGQVFTSTQLNSTLNQVDQSASSAAGSIPKGDDDDEFDD